MLHGEPRVRAPNEEELGLVHTGQLLEELGVFRRLLGDPPARRHQEGRSLTDQKKKLPGIIHPVTINSSCYLAL